MKCFDRRSQLRHFADSLGQMQSFVFFLHDKQPYPSASGIQSMLAAQVWHMVIISFPYRAYGIYYILYT